MKTYQKIASLLQAIENCRDSGNVEWEENHTQAIDKIASDNLPSGSGVDSGTTIDLEASAPNKIVLVTSYHHMNENGYYDGWSDHKVIITPSLANGFEMKVTGRDRNDIKEYLYQTFEYALNSEE